MGFQNDKGTPPAPVLVTSCLLSAVDRNHQAFSWLARRIQVSTTVSGFSEMLSMP